MKKVQRMLNFHTYKWLFCANCDVIAFKKEYLPSFDDFLATNLHRLKLNELHILILLRLHFKAVDVAGMIGISKSQISQNSTEIMKKIYNAKGSSKELSARIGEIF